MNIASSALRVSFLLLVGLTLVACDSSSRFGGGGPDFSAPPPPAAPVRPQSMIAAPTNDVQTSALPPPRSGNMATPNNNNNFGNTSNFGTNNGATPPVTAPNAPNQNPYAMNQEDDAAKAVRLAKEKQAKEAREGKAKQQVASRSTATESEEKAAAPTTYSVAGNYSLQEGASGSCRITLSSTAKLDLNGASTSGCQSKDFQKINAWELRGDEVYLYEPGGAVSARLKRTGSKQFAGASSKSGAPVSISK